MTDQELKQTVFVAVKQETGFDASTLDPNGDIRNQVNLDSMQFVGILARVEEALAIELPIEAVTVRTLSEFFMVLRRQLAAA